MVRAIKGEAGRHSRCLEADSCIDRRVDHNVCLEGEQTN